MRFATCYSGKIVSFNFGEITMHTQITSKLVSLILALTLNTMIVAGVGAVLKLQIRHRCAESQTNVSMPATHAMV
jgi:hypothetical protein